MFNIPGAGPHTITPTNTQTGSLPVITDPVYIDGTSQPGYAGTPLIEINGAAAAPGSNGLHITAFGNTVRGLAINRFVRNGGGFGGAGIVIVGGGGNVIERNFLGTDPTGTIARPNQADGIFLEGSPNNVIGGASVASRNLLSGNGRFGLMLNGAGTVGTVVRNNLVGTDALGTGPLGNTDAGIAIFSGSQSMIGGPNGDAANTIAFNGGAGVHIATGSQNSVLLNRIFDNGSLGINLGGTLAVTPNDAGDNDGGANTMQNFPVLSAGTAGVRVELNSTPNTTFRLEFFTSATCDASGFGEGSNVFTVFPVTTDANGNFILEEFPAQPGLFLTATATNPSGNTSEFSQCLELTPGLALTLPDNQPIGIGRTVTATVAIPEPAPTGGLVVTITSDAPTIASIAAPGTVTIPQGSSTAQIAVTGENVGDTTLRADADGYAGASRTVAVTQNLVSTPSTLNVAFGQSTALPINIGPSEAPPGGLTLSVVSSNPSVVEVVTPQVTVPEGALSANATVRGNGFGTATVTVSNPSYSPSQTAVTSSGGLNILQTAATLHVGLPASILTLRLESNGTPVAALNDLVVTLSSANSQCVVVPPSTTIPTGLVSATFAVSPGTSSTLPCTAVVTANSSGLTTDTVSVTVNQQAGITMPPPPAVGAGLQVATGATLGASEHGGVMVTIQSTNPARVLVSPDQNTAGTTSFTTTVPNGQTSVPYYVQGVEGVAASATVNVSAPGFSTASHAVDVVPIGVEIINLPGATTTLSDDDTSWYVAIGIPCAGNTNVCTYQGVRAGASPLVVTLALTPAQTPVAQLKSDQPVTTAQTVTKPIQPAFAHTQAVAGGTIYGLAFDPLAQGTTTVTVSAPAALTMSTTGSLTVTISGPGISVPATPTVGAGLQVATGATLGASGHGGVTVTVQSTNPARVLVSPDQNTAGTTSFTTTVPNGQTSVPYYVQGVEGVAASATVNVSAPGFGTASHAVDVVPIGVEIINLPGATTTLSDDDTSWYVAIGIPCAGNTNVCTYQGVRAGASPLVVTLALTPAQTPVAQLKSDQPVTTAQTVTKPIQPAFAHTQAVAGGTIYGLAFDPLAQGTTTVTVSAPAALTMSTTGSLTVTISGPGISVPATPTVGAGLQVATGATLGASGHGGVTVTVQSTNPARVLVSPDQNTAGTTSFTTTVPNGQTSVPYYVQGVEGVAASATVNVSAPGFGTASHAVDVVPIGVEIINLDTSQTNLSPMDVDWYVAVGVPCAGNTNVCTYQGVRAGGPPFIVTLTNTNANVARLSSDQPLLLGQSVGKPIQPGFAHTQATSAGTIYGLGFDPLANGDTTVSVAGPIGVLTMTTTGQRDVTVSTPSIPVSSPTMTVGSGLQLATSAGLTASEHGGVTVTITSSAPSVMLVSPDATTPGTTSFTINVPNGQTFLNYYVQGVENTTGTATVTLSAPGFTNATATVTVSPSAIEIYNLPATVSASSANILNWYVAVGLPFGDGSALATTQAVRAGSPGFVVTLTNSTAAVAQLGSDEPAVVGQTVGKAILPGFAYTQAVPSGTQYGLLFDPLAPGTTTVTATGPGNVISTSQASRTVIVGGGTTARAHQGATDPVIEGFANNGVSSGTPAIGDGGPGIDAWRVLSTTFETGFYASAMTTSETQQAVTNGWRLTARMRVESGLANVNADLGGFGRRFDIHLRRDANGDTVVRLTTSVTPFSGMDFTLAGSGSSYHTYELVFDPVSQSADLFIDGVERLSDYIGHTQFQGATGSLLFGAGAFGGQNGIGYHSLARLDLNQ